MKKKRIFSGLLAVAMALSLCSFVQPVVASAEEVAEGCYVGTVVDGAVMIAYGSNPVGDVVIPDTLCDLPVWGIGTSAFGGCNGIESVTVPDGINIIEPYAFSECKNLKEVSISGTVSVIDMQTFAYCDNLTTVTLAEGVSEIRDAFMCCSSLTSITIPFTVGTIYGNAFYDCWNLTDVYYSGTQEQWEQIYIEEMGNEHLQNATIHYNSTGPVTIIESGICGEDLTWTLDDVGTLTISGTGAMTAYAYDSASATKSTHPWSTVADSINQIIIEDGVTAIGDNAFTYLLNVTAVSIPNSVATIGKSAFWNCVKLAEVVLPESVTSIGNLAFRNCTSLTQISIPSGVLSINEGLFAGCSGLREITLPDNLAIIARNAFEKCTALKEIKIPDRVTRIEIATFLDCTGLTSVTLGNSVKIIGEQAFYGCTSLTGIEIPDSVTTIGNAAFNRCSNLAVVTLGNGLTSIETGAFTQCTKLTQITIPDSVTSMGDSVFYWCNRLAKVTLSRNITSIKKSTFYECDALTEIVIPEGVTSIGDYAFRGSGNLTAVTIPDSVTAIGNYAFYDCRKLQSVYYAGTQEQWNAITVGNENQYLLDATVYYPEVIVGDETYKSLADALTVAQSGDTVKLLADVQVEDILLTNGVTIDLDGNTLTVDALTAYAENLADGYIIDSSNGNNGLLVIEKDAAVFKSDNPDMPLYDAENGGYRFFNYKQTVHNKSTNVGKGMEKFWSKFHFYTDDTCTALDADAYSVVAMGDSGMEMGAQLTWKDKLLPRVRFEKNGSADAFCQDWTNEITQARWLYVTVSSLNKIGVGMLQVKPVIVANGVEAVSDTMTFQITENYGWSEGVQ